MKGQGQQSSSVDDALGYRRQKGGLRAAKTRDSKRRKERMGFRAAGGNGRNGSTRGPHKLKGVAVCVRNTARGNQRKTRSLVGGCQLKKGKSKIAGYRMETPSGGKKKLPKKGDALQRERKLKSRLKTDRLKTAKRTRYGCGKKKKQYT